MAHVALGKRFKVRSRLSSDVGNFLDKQSQKMRDPCRRAKP
jgi:hypothetical protein